MVRNFRFNRYIYLISFLFILSCQHFDHTNKYIQIDSNSELDLEVNYVKLANGLIINDEYYSSGVFFIIENKKLPKWIYDKKKMEAVPPIDKYGQTYLGLWDIVPPYQIIKKKNSNVMLIVKEKDTLKAIIP